MHQPIGWTAKLVSEVMIDALRWAALTAGPVGPSGFVTSRATRQFRATLEDHLDEGWGLPEPAEDEPEKKIRPAYSPEKIAVFRQALQWQTKYLFPDHQEVGRVLGVWLRSRARKGAFDRQVASLGYSRKHCYRIKDKGLGLIARGLHRDGVPMPERQTLSEPAGTVYRSRGRRCAERAAPGGGEMAIESKPPARTG